MNRNHHHPHHPVLPFLLLLVTLAACSAPTATLPAIPSQLPQELTATSTPLQPEPTPPPVPLAAQVNEDGIPLADYQTELAQIQKAQADLGKTATPQDQRQKALDDLIDQ